MQPTSQKLLELTSTYGTPLYVYNTNLILKRYKELFEYIPWKKLHIYYAMKANYNIHILQTLQKVGARIDAVSPGDVEMALAAGFTPERILYTANRITDEEMHIVVKHNVLCNIGSLSRLEKYGKAYPNGNVCIRFNPMVIAGEHENVRTGGENTKFGIFLHHKKNVIKIASKYNLKIIGVHEHTGSGIPETVQMMQGMKNILDTLNKTEFPHLQFVDFGGGFKVPYKPEDTMPDYTQFGNEVVKIFSSFCEKYGKELEMYFEPGKFLVAECGQLLLQVTDIKQTKDKLFAGTNAGFPQLIRPMFYQAYHQILNLSNLNGNEQTYDVIGNICESGDCFAVNRKLPQIKEGDILCILNAGAYCYSMGGFYNLRPMPAEVIISEEKTFLSRKRVTPKELVQNILNESTINII